MKSQVAERVRKHRAGLRESGLRPLQIWVPDTRRRGFAAECRRQSQLLRKAPGEEEVLKWLELAAGEIEGWVSTPSREDRTSGTPV
jgi:hypothetical protein